MISQLSYQGLQNNVTGSSSGTVVKEYHTDTYHKVFGNNDAYVLGLNAEDMPVCDLCKPDIR